MQQTDKYGRLLAYVWYKLERYCPPTASCVSGEIFLNSTIIKEGCASPMTVPPNVKYADLFQKLYQEARENKRGLWKE